MRIVLPYMILPVASYLLGSVPFGLIVAKMLRGIDIREFGSKNIGATNVGRVLGKPAGVAVFFLDMGKGLVPTIVFPMLATLAYPMLATQRLGIPCGACAILGHTFPVYLRLRGGKAVATSTGVFLGLAWLPTVLAGAIWIVMVFVTRYVSVASMTAAVALVVGIAALVPNIFGDELPILIFATLIAALVIYRHKANIQRLRNGTENKVLTRPKQDNA